MGRYHGVMAAHYPPAKCALKFDNGTELWAGSLMDRPPWTPTLTIVLDASLQFSDTVQLNPAAKKLLGEHSGLADSWPQVLVDWYDGEVPPFKRDWWEHLLGVIEGLPAGSTVLMGCTGGTGRTGTALAILCGLKFGIADPVDYVRKFYKPTAVETFEQIAYINAICRTKSVAVGSLEFPFLQGVRKPTGKR